MKPKISERKNRLENEIVILPLITSFSSVVKALAGGGGWTTGDDGLFIIGAWWAELFLIEHVELRH